MGPEMIHEMIKYSLYYSMENSKLSTLRKEIFKLFLCGFPQQKLIKTTTPKFGLVFYIEYYEKEFINFSV